MACGAGWFASGDRYAQFWGQLSILGDAGAAPTARFVAAALLALGAWLVSVGEALAAALLVFIATASIGAIVGFLFGVPRPLSESGPGAASAAAAASSAAASPAGSAAGAAAAAPTQAALSAPAASPGWYANTNLTQVSDWLTKIIVGVGLVEATRVGGVAQDIAAYVRPLLFGGDFGAALVVPALMLIGLIVGFMYCYLFTQLFLAALMAQTAEAISRNVDLFQAEPRASSEMFSIAPGAFVVAPPITVPGSAAPVRASPSPTLEQMKAATQISSVPLSDVDDPASLAVWARAGAVLDDYGRAVTGYTKLLAKQRTPEILIEAARVFASAKDFQSARRLIGEAFARRDATTDPATRVRIIFDVAHLALYDAPPDGYRRARQLLEEPALLDQDVNGGLHVLHACALGQRLAFEKDSLSEQEKKTIRRQVLEDLRFALASPVNRPWITYLLGRDAKGQSRPAAQPGQTVDDDLFPFKGRSGVPRSRRHQALTRDARFPRRETGLAASSDCRAERPWSARRAGT